MTNKHPSSNFTSIPAEVWETIFNKLPNSSQRECQRVCKLWYLPAQRAFLEHVVLASCYDVEKFLECFLTFGTPASFASVKSIRIGSTYTPPDRARHLLESNAIEQLIHHFPHVLELVISGNIIELDYFSKQDIVTAMRENWPLLQVFRVDSGWLHPDKQKIYLHTNFKLRSSIQQLVLYEVTEEMGGLKAYLNSFPNLQNIKVVSSEVCKLESCLPVIEYCQQLKALDLYVTRQDQVSIFDRYIRGMTSGSRLLFEEKLQSLQSLKLTMATFCFNTIDFMIQHLLGLQQVIFGINRINVEEWTEIQKYTFSHGFLDFLSKRETFTFKSIQLNYNEENEYVDQILQKLYHQIPSQYNSKQVERQIHIILKNNRPGPESDRSNNHMFSNIRNFTFEMESKLSEQGVLIRSASFSYDNLQQGGLRNKSLEYLKHMDGILDCISRLTFDTFDMWVLTEKIPNLFEDTMQQFRHLKQVTVHLRSNSFLCREVSTVHSQLTHLEITAGNSLWFDQDMFSLASQCFPSLKYLSLWFFCGYYKEQENIFIVDMVETNLERLHLDVTPIRVQFGRMLKKVTEIEKCFFILKVTTTEDKTMSWYRVSMDYLFVVKLEDGKIDMDQEEQDEYITMHLIFKSIQYVNLYFYRKFSDDFRPVLVMDPKDLIQSSICV
jgi:hypothetical protein